MIVEVVGGWEGGCMRFCVYMFISYECGMYVCIGNKCMYRKQVHLIVTAPKSKHQNQSTEIKAAVMKAPAIITPVAWDHWG
jgi:hypothetical protein